MTVCVIGTGVEAVESAVGFAELSYSVLLVLPDLDGKTSLSVIGQALQELFEFHLESQRIQMASVEASILSKTEAIYFVDQASASQEASPCLPLLRRVLSPELPCFVSPKLLVLSTFYSESLRTELDQILSDWPTSICSPQIAVLARFVTCAAGLEAFLKPTRLVIGVAKPTQCQELELFFARFGVPLLITDFQTARRTQQVSNALFGLQRSLFTRVAQLCQKEGLDFQAVVDGSRQDPAFNRQAFRPGLGLGSALVDHDLRDLALALNQLDGRTGLLDAAVSWDLSQSNQIAAWIRSILTNSGGNLVAISGWPLAEDSVGFSNGSIQRLCHELQKSGFTLRLLLPSVDSSRSELFSLIPGVQVASDFQELLHQADAWIVVGSPIGEELQTFLSLRKAMQSPHLFDLVPYFDPNEMTRAGFIYHRLQDIGSV